jgi:hypothetical protein
MGGSKLKSTFSLLGIFAATVGFLYVMDHGVPGMPSIPLPSGLKLSSGPKFKVEYGYFMVPALDCPGGTCQRPQTQRLKVQSLNEGPITIKEVVVNDRAGCVATLFGLFDLRGTTMKYGDVGYVMTTCEPARFRIVTEKGENTYSFE